MRRCRRLGHSWRAHKGGLPFTAVNALGGLARQRLFPSLKAQLALPMMMSENAARDSVDNVVAAPAPASRTNPSLTATLQADYDAIRNDLEQAQELAADFQRLAADKSNEVAHIKTLLEKTTGDLTRLEEHVAELRRERHRLANELMIAASMDLELAKLKRERDNLRTELEILSEASKLRITDLQAEVISQRTEIASLQARLCSAEAGQANPEAVASDAAMQKINELSATVNKLMGMVESKPENDPQRPESTPPQETIAIPEDHFIDIAFDR